MLVSEYIEKFTKGSPIRLKHVFSEVKEFTLEILKRDKRALKEELEDIFLFFQLWLFWRFNINGELWKISKNSTKKFMDRRPIWNEIYQLAGLPQNVSGYSGNYKKLEKVVRHLNSFGIEEKVAIEIYNSVVKNKEK